MALLLNAKDITVEFPAKRVLSAVTLGINEGDRIGIVGRNGEGKSTLLGVLSDSFTPDSGEVIRRHGLTVGVLSQDDTLDLSLTVEQAVVGTTPRHIWASDRRTREIIQVLLEAIPWDKRIRDLSGGQMRRVVLAHLLIGSWDVLMLDEPTNHLDISTIAWLAQHLRNRWAHNCGALLLVTHDRWFLDEVAATMWEVHNGNIETFEGGFSAYIQQRVERQRLEDIREERRRKLLRKELAWLSRGAQARSTKPKFRIKSAQALIENEPPARNEVELRRASMARLGKQVIEMRGVTKSFNGTEVLRRTDWIIGPGDRIGILGANGSGKTTFLRLITGLETPSSGQLRIGQTVRMVYLSQRLEELEPFASFRVRDVLAEHKTHLLIDGKSVSSSQLLERLGFEREHLQSLVGDLSGGQKRRLQILLTLIDEPNVLLMDEPDNDMDIDMLAALEDLLDTWPGTLLLVSHDRHLLERVTDNQYAFIEGEVRHMPGGVDQYLKILSESEVKASEHTALKQPPDSQHSTTSGAPASKHPSTRKPANPLDAVVEELESGEAGEQATIEVDAYQLRKSLRSVERKLQTLERKREELLSSQHEADPSDYVELGRIQQEIQEINHRTERLEQSWLEISELLER